MSAAHIGGVGSVQVIGGLTLTRVAAETLKAGDKVKGYTVISVQVEGHDGYYNNSDRVTVITEKRRLEFMRGQSVQAQIA